MAARLGLKPWERDRLEPVEIREMYDGMIWRHSRQVELVAIQTWLVRAMMTKDEKLATILDSFPYYEREEKP